VYTRSVYYYEPIKTKGARKPVSQSNRAGGFDAVFARTWRSCSEPMAKQQTEPDGPTSEEITEFYDLAVEYSGEFVVRENDFVEGIKAALGWVTGKQDKPELSSRV
jgi:hypothetical protein